MNIEQRIAALERRIKPASIGNQNHREGMRTLVEQMYAAFPSDDFVREHGPGKGQIRLIAPPGWKTSADKVQAFAERIRQNISDADALILDGLSPDALRTINMTASEFVRFLAGLHDN